MKYVVRQEKQVTSIIIVLIVLNQELSLYVVLINCPFDEKSTSLLLLHWQKMPPFMPSRANFKKNLRKCNYTVWILRSVFLGMKSLDL